MLSKKWFLYWVTGGRTLSGRKMELLPDSFVVANTVDGARRCHAKTYRLKPGSVKANPVCLIRRWRLKCGGYPSIKDLREMGFEVTQEGGEKYTVFIQLSGTIRKWTGVREPSSDVVKNQANLEHDNKCLVLNCENRRRQGAFVGKLCAPCYEFITTGKGRYSQAYRNALATVLGGFSEALMCEVASRLDPTNTVHFSVVSR